ncbi:MAG: glycerate kinase [Acidiferrobacterales bacterium]
MPSADTHRKNLLAIFQAALTRVNGRACVRRYLESHPEDDDIYMIAIGKPAASMVQGALDALGDKIRDALVITKHGHAESLPWPCLTAGHPLPDAASLTAGDELLRFIARIPSRSRVLVLLSGGTSALVERLPEGGTLDHLQAVNRWMLAAGLDIQATNYIRKRVSLFKGGRLALLLAPHPVLCLTISDVPDNDPATIGSGPLVPDTGLQDVPVSIAGVPMFIRDLLSQAPPVPDPGDPRFDNVETVIVANLEDAKRAAGEAAQKKGYCPLLEPAFITGDALAIGVSLAKTLLQADSGAIHIWGGETQVKLPDNPGRGGRSQSLALAAALQLQGRDDVLFLAAGTDGTDGPGEDAGALVDGGTVARGETLGRDAVLALEQADAGSFLEASGDLLRTGPTGTNVMDLMLGLKY